MTYAPITILDAADASGRIVIRANAGAEVDGAGSRPRDCGQFVTRWVAGSDYGPDEPVPNQHHPPYKEVSAADDATRHVA